MVVRVRIPNFTATLVDDASTGTIAASTTLAGEGVSEAETTGTISASSSVSGDGGTFVTADGSISANTTLSGDGLAEIETSGILSSLAVLSAEGEADAAGTGTISVITTVESVVTEIEANGTIDATTTASADGVAVKEADGTVIVLTTIDGQIVPEASTTGSIAASATLLGEGSAEAESVGSISVATTVSGDITGEAERDGAIIASTDVFGSGIVDAAITGTVSAISNVQAVALVDTVVQGDISAFTVIQGHGVVDSVEVEVVGSVLARSEIMGDGQSVLPFAPPLPVGAARPPIFPDGLPDFRFVTVHRPGPTVLEVRWAFLPHLWPQDDMAVLVFRSNGPEGPWEERAEVQTGTFSYFDTDVTGGGTYRQYYYLLRVLSKSGRGFRDYPPVRLVHDPDNISLELVRKKDLFLKVNGGIDTVVYLKRSWGPKCSRCYNEERGLPEDADCPNCYGTGFTGGYLDPVRVPMLFNPPEKAILRAGVKFTPESLFAEASNRPFLSPEDVVVDLRMNIRYRVERSRPTSHLMHPVSQILTLLRADESDVIYTLPVPEAIHADRGRGHDLLVRNVPLGELYATPQLRQPQ